MRGSFQIAGRRARPAGAAAIAAVLLAGCATPPLELARQQAYQGRLDAADRTLSSPDVRVAEKDKVLFLMERGAIRQARGAYEDSSHDFIGAADQIEKLDYFGVSGNIASLAVNDSTQNYLGALFERALLHALTALNHFALGAWDNAAVEGRRIVQTFAPARRGEYPEDAFSYYVAGLSFELIDDPSNAALMYRNAARLTATPLDERGRVGPFAAATNVPPARVRSEPAAELVCFVLLGFAPRVNPDWEPWLPPMEAAYAEIRAGDRVLGRSHPLADTARLASITAQKDALRKAGKTALRIGIKEGLAQAVEHNTDNHGLGDLVRLLLIGLLEHPDERRWATLPRSLQVARVPCPPNLTSVTVVFKSATGATLRTVEYSTPLRRRGRLWVTFCREPSGPDPIPEVRM